MIKDMGFIFFSNGGRVEKAAASQNCKYGISHTLPHIQTTAKVLEYYYYALKFMYRYQRRQHTHILMTNVYTHSA